MQKKCIRDESMSTALKKNKIRLWSLHVALICRSTLQQ